MQESFRNFRHDVSLSNTILSKKHKMSNRFHPCKRRRHQPPRWLRSLSTSTRSKPRMVSGFHGTTGPHLASTRRVWSSSSVVCTRRSNESKAYRRCPTNQSSARTVVQCSILTGLPPKSMSMIPKPHFRAGKSDETHMLSVLFRSRLSFRFVATAVPQSSDRCALLRQQSRLSQSHLDLQLLLHAEPLP